MKKSQLEIKKKDVSNRAEEVSPTGRSIDSNKVNGIIEKYNRRISSFLKTNFKLSKSSGSK